MLCLWAADVPMLRNGGAGSSQDSEDGGVGFDRPDHAAVFDLSMDSDDDVLLDWEAYAGVCITVRLHALVCVLPYDTLCT